MWLISYCSRWLSLLSSWLVIWSVVHFVRAGSRGRPRGQGCRASSPGWTPVEPAAHVDQSSWPWSLSSWKLWAKDLTEPTQASRLLILLLLVVVPGKGRLHLALEQQPWWALFSPQLSTKQIHSENFTHQHSRGSCDHSEEPPGCKFVPDKGMIGGHLFWFDVRSSDKAWKNACKFVEDTHSKNEHCGDEEDGEEHPVSCCQPIAVVWTKVRVFSRSKHWFSTE